MSRTLQLTEQLIARASVTPDDAGCQALLAERLQPLGFACETITSGPADFRVSNLWAKRVARAGAPLLVFAGHTDVVPTGPVAQWSQDPFTPTHRDGKLYGRGAWGCAATNSSTATTKAAIEVFMSLAPRSPRRR